MKNIKKILVAIDRSAMAEEALKRAISMAKEKSAQLIVIHVIEPYFIESPFIPSVDEEDVKQKVTEQVDRLTAAEDLDYILFVESGSAASSIILTSQKTKADLLIIGTHGKDDLVSNYLGSTTLEVVQKTHIPVLIVKNEAKFHYKNLLAPTNLSDSSKESIQFSRTLFNATSLKYLHAYVTTDEFQALTYRISIDQQAQFKKELLFEAKTALERFVKETGEGEMVLISYQASINEDLLEYITKDQADLLVLGSRSVGDLNSFLFGSTASYLVQRSPIDVLVYVPINNKD